MALPPAFMDELRARTPISAVIGRRVRLARSGRNWKGCCPFHGEKTPSFYVYDDHFHCFGCGAHGDAIGFVMQSQGSAFMEAVEQLASEAGLSVPKPTPEAAEAERHRLDLNAVLEAAAAAYQRRLHLPEGRAALSYLQTRGLTDETIDRFGLGWSGEGRGALAADLGREGVTQDQLVEAGLMRRDEDTGRVTDLFYNRVMFPIRDRRGRAISFGGRIMGDGQPKYVNGPETELFSKRRNLYGLDQAREAMRAGAILLVVEGYMDVIALHQAGFRGAVAPLGTALTDEQLEGLWRLSPAPVLCFDGDAAGGRAAARSAELALPLISAERGLRLMNLPAGEDPDSLVRRQGAASFQSAIDGARPLSDTLYDLLRPPGGANSPEQRAAFRSRLVEASNRIDDKGLGAEYRRVLLDRFFVEGRSASNDRFKPRGGAYRPGQRPGNQPSNRPTPPRPTPTGDQTGHERARILTAILVRHPTLWHDVYHAYEALPLDPALDRLRSAMIHWAEHAEVLDTQGLMDHLTSSGLKDDVERVLAAAPVPLPGCAAPEAMPAEAESGWWHIFGFLNVEHLRQEVAQSQITLARDMTAENQARHQALTEALRKVQAGETDGVELAA